MGCNGVMSEAGADGGVVGIAARSVGVSMGSEELHALRRIRKRRIIRLRIAAVDFLFGLCAVGLVGSTKNPPRRERRAFGNRS